MNAARLTRRWQDVAGDPARMAEAPVDEINGAQVVLVGILVTILVQALR